VVGDGQLGDAALHGLRGEDVDRHVAVRRQVGVQVRVERQVARLAVDRGHRWSPRRSLTR
jgi:hypothetical protein